MKSPRKLMTLSVMALALFLPGCSESGMRADQDQAEVPAGTQLYVRVNQHMGTDTQGSSQGESQGWKSGDEFQGTLARALEVAGQVIAPEGTIVKGEFTDDLDDSGTARGDTRSSDTRAGDSTAADRSATGDPTMSAGGTNRDRLGLELKKIVLNGEEYDISTQAVPVPGSMGMAGSSGSGSSTPGRDRAGSSTGERSGGMTGDSTSGSMAQSHIAGQEFVFTLEDEVELPSTTNMKTE